jgi:hypothetical protein
MMEDYSQFIHKTDSPNIMIISSKRSLKEEKPEDKSILPQQNAEI